MDTFTSMDDFTGLSFLEILDLTENTPSAIRRHSDDSDPSAVPVDLDKSLQAYGSLCVIS
ncbi:hypothetical protein BDN70DRAFT_881213 [Pholiota conissans]|uniref:Pheromone n=1 Tax=Pholiota conissans TaxID=109636 RepID=A0A9P6CSL3_9AGAR|nr:hypothetical protein BDN70DRAFT_881213 [Pholiota conissans]